MAWGYLFIFILFYFALIIYVWRKKHPKRKLITVLMLLGPLGFAIALVILFTYKTTDTQINHSYIYQCPTCGSPYRLQDYRPDATIVCSTCKKIIPHPIAT
jgi:energy-coupling factor transporter transmembrane protein EcfT